MSNQERSGFPVIRTGAAIGAVAGFLLQVAMLIWAIVETGGMPGTLELLMAGVITLIVAGVGAVSGAIIGVIVKALLPEAENR